MLRKLFSAFKKQEEERERAADAPPQAAAPVATREAAAAPPPAAPVVPPEPHVAQGAEELVDAFVEFGLLSAEEARAYDEALARHEAEIERETRQWREKTRETWFGKLRDGLAKTKNALVRRIEEALGDRMAVDASTIDTIEEILIEADIGAETVQLVVDRLHVALDEKRIAGMADVKALIRDILLELLGGLEENPPLQGVTAKPAVLMVVGVNGVGKTTTIGKLAAQYRLDGKSVLIAAGDTFRAGAIEQVEIWAKRVGVHVVKGEQGADAAAVVFDALKAAKARGSDIVIVDTAGRLHTKFNLMEEVRKIERVIARECPGAPHEVLMVLDGTTGQNAIQQAEKFREAVAVSGLCITKLDGTAKGGAVIAIARRLSLPIKLIGVGEGVGDLRPFRGRDFVNAIFG